MENNWLSIEHVERQEIDTKKRMESKFGKGRNGFCDYALDGIDLIIKGLYMTDHDIFIDKNKIKYNDFKHAIRTFSYYHYYRIIYTFKAAYNLVLQGYDTESAFLMRHIVETFVLLKFIAKKKDDDLVNLALAGHIGINGEKFYTKYKYKEQFDEIAPGLYEHYQIMCDMSHGALAAQLLKSDLFDNTFKLDVGIQFDPEKSTFIINQFSVYLLAHLVYMKWLFPEIDKKRSKSYEAKKNKTLVILWQLMKEMSEDDKRKKWYDAVKQLVDI